MVDLKRIPSLPTEDQAVHEVQQVQNSSTRVDLKHIPSHSTENQTVYEAHQVHQVDLGFPSKREKRFAKFSFFFSKFCFYLFCEKFDIFAKYSETLNNEYIERIHQMSYSSLSDNGMLQIFSFLIK